MRGFHALCCAIIALCVSGCATSYQSQGITGGYSEKQLEPGVWRVAFGGNGYTTREAVQTYWLYRCTEITLQNGYSGFQILSGVTLISNDRDEFDSANLIPIHGGGGGGGGGGHGSRGGAYVYIPGGTMMEKPYIVADIRLLKGPITEDPPKVFDAAALKQTLEPLVKGKLCDGNVCPHVHRYVLPKENVPVQSSAPSGA
ncbi:MAG: hypothetical protein WCA81_03855 [Rhizomicrobium sp.]